MYRDPALNSARTVPQFGRHIDRFRERQGRTLACSTQENG